MGERRDLYWAGMVMARKRSGFWTGVPFLIAAAALSALSPPSQAKEWVSFPTCIDALRRELRRERPVRPETFDTHVRDAVDLREPIQAAADYQPEFKLPVWDYVARLVDPQRITDGNQMLSAQSVPLLAIAARRDVDPATLVAVFGVETDYGRVRGRYRVVDATLSRACLDLKNEDRKRQFFSALWLLQEGLVAPDRFMGSWAGAFGLTQFMPATFVAYMDSASEGERVDIIGSMPDALATTARFIASHGWDGALRWGVEVAPVPNAVRTLVASEREHACLMATNLSGKCRSVEQWLSLGVRTMDSQSARTIAGWPRLTRAALLAPTGPDGPTWLVTRNFQSIWQYNRSDAYALAIGLLADALRGEPPVRTAWPTDDLGLSRAEFAEVQRSLVRLGHVDVVVDGLDGLRTQAAIIEEEKKLGWPETGRAGARFARAISALSGAGK